MSVKVSIIIPNWNGKAFLERCVGAVLQSAVEYGQPFECLLIDDASSDNSAQEVASKFSQVTLVQQNVNLGFGQTINNGANRARGDIIVLVNNDLIARSRFISALCNPFEQSDKIFGVSGKTIDWEKSSPNHVNMRGEFNSGSFSLTWSDDSEQTETMFLQGGSCAFRRDLFLQFGGFQKLYAPGYWEDYDISFQALKAGYTNLYEPASVGAHLGQGSMIRAHGHDRIQFVRERNRHLLLALNLTGDAHKQFWNAMPRYVCSDGPTRFKHRFAILKFLFDHHLEIARIRRERALRQAVTDEEIFSRFSGIGTPV